MLSESELTTAVIDRRYSRISKQQGRLAEPSEGNLPAKAHENSRMIINR
jgi:hypothetical protein